MNEVDMDFCILKTKMMIQKKKQKTNKIKNKIIKDKCFYEHARSIILNKTDN